MKTIYMAALDLEVPLGRFQSYTDHGFVENAKSYARKNSPIVSKIEDVLIRSLEILHDKCKYKDIKSEIVQILEDSRRGCAGCAWAKPFSLFESNSHNHLKKFQSVHICYEDQKNDAYNYNLRAHEETHALQAFGQLSILERVLSDEQGVRIDLRKIKDIEVCANIGSIYASKKRGSLGDVNMDWSDSFNQAFNLYVNNWDKKTFPKVKLHSSVL